MHIQLTGSNHPFTANSSIFYNNGLKSTQEKLQRQAERDNQIAFWEDQKNNLKNMKCDSLDGIGRKLDLFHSYEDQIAEVKKEYNYSQMFRATDEAREMGERIAKAAEKYAPKTAEERKEEMVEEALGIDEIKGELTENMKELSRLAEEMTDEVTRLAEDTTELTEEAGELSADTKELIEEATVTDLREEAFPGQPAGYKRINLLI